MRNMTPEDKAYPCVECGTMRSKAEGGTVFTVCDDCWDKHRAAPPAGGTREAETAAVSEAHLVNRLTLTEEEDEAYRWALQQQFQSVSARFARTLAGVVRRALAAPGAGTTEREPTCPRCGPRGDVLTECAVCGEEWYTKAQSLAHSRAIREGRLPRPTGAPEPTP